MKIGAILSACLMAGVAAAALPAMTIAAPAAKAPAAKPVYKAPRAADGHADISGVWSNATLTRLERAANYGDRLVMTPEELKKLETDTLERNKRQNKNTDQATIENWKTDALKPDTSDECRSGSRGAACGYNAGWTDPGDLVMRVNGEPRTSFITFPANGRVPPSIRQAAASRSGDPAAAAAARAAAIAARANQGGEGDEGPSRPGQNDNPETRSLGERCIMSFGQSSGPVMQPQLYNNNYRFLQTKDHVAIWVEMVHDVRIVRLNAQHRTDGVRPYMGDSIGWWDGDTLVVETTNFHPSQNVRGSGPKLKVTEKFTRVAPTRLLYQFKVEDPDTWTQPWGGEYEFASIPGDVYEYACHEGNYGLEGILAGARQEEADAKAKTASAAAPGR